MPYIWLASTFATVTSVVPMNYRFPYVKEEILSEDNDGTLNEVLGLVHSGSSHAQPTPTAC
jgi:hypothetical protein